jgi:GH24 family phage-related lysozyme (muramidase)
MQVNASGMGLIESFEGCRTEAYQDCIGIWTIGYGHTSAAGSPQVEPGMTISKTEGQALLKTDIENFSKGVTASLRTPLNDNQFSALVSFAYNVGLAAFRRSSVLRAVNAGQFQAVPGLMVLWVKAGGKVVPGLVARRAAEATLFCKADDSMANAPRPALAGTPANQQSTEMPQDVGPVEPIARILASPNTIGAALISAIGGIVSSAARHLEDLIGQHISLALEVAGVAAVLACAAWIYLEHRSKSRQLSA